MIIIPDHFLLFKKQGNVLELSRCGLQQHTVQQLMEQATLGKSALRHLDMRDYSYSWRS